MGVSGAGRGQLADDAARRRRHHVHHAAPERRRRARRRDGARVLDLPYRQTADRIVCCGANNRGLAILGDTLFMGTLDAQLIAIDAKTGRPLWKTEVADTKSGYSMTLAPLVVKDKVIVGVGGGEFGIRGFIAAYDANTGKEVWRFYTIPAPGEPGHETWERCPPATRRRICDPDAWKHGGGSIWLTGSYDPQLNLTYWGVGNVGPDYNGAQRPGDNLYTGFVVALDADTGKLTGTTSSRRTTTTTTTRCRFRCWPTTGRTRGIKVMLWANRNGFFYVLDRATGRFLLGKPFVKVNWISGFDERGRPIQTPQPPGQPTYPGNQGGTNWYSPSYSPRTGLSTSRPGRTTRTSTRGASASAVQGRAELRRRRPTNFGPVPGAPGPRAARPSTPGPKRPATAR